MVNFRFKVGDKVRVGPKHHLWPGYCGRVIAIEDGDVQIKMSDLGTWWFFGVDNGPDSLVHLLPDEGPW